jgi:hypothetical protein
MPKPFRLLNSKTEKEKSRYSLPRELEGIQWAEVSHNIGTEGYHFKGDSVTIKLLWATGYCDSSHKWLVGSIENWQDCFDIQHQKYTGKNDKGYATYEDNPEQKEITEAWENQGALTAICCDGIPQLEYLAEFAVGRVIFNHTGYPVYLTGKPDKATFDFTAKTILEAKDSSFDYNLLKHNKIPEMKKFKQENSWFYILWDEELYNDPDMLDFTRLSTVLDNDIITVEFNDGYLVKATLNWSPPEVKAQGNYNRGGGAKEQTEAEILKERVEFVTSELKVSSLLELSEKYGNELCPIHVDLVMSLAVGASWTNHHYNSQAKPLYNQLYNVNGNGKVEQGNAKPPKEENYDNDEAIYPENKSEEDNPLYLAKCVQLLNAEDRTFPAEINIEFLRQQSEEWLTLFFQFCTGSIETKQGDKTPFAKGVTRVIHTWVKLRCPETKGLHTLTEEQLGTLINDKEFKCSSEMVL